MSSTARLFNWPGMLFVLGLLLLWELLAHLNSSASMPSLGVILATLVANGGALMVEASYTMGRALAGLSIALLTGILFGILFGRVKLFGDIAMPTFDILRPLPPIAIAPVAMIFGGTGTAAKIAVIAYGCFFPILITTFDAVRTIQPQLVLAGRSLGMRPFEIMRLIDLPSELPKMATGVRISLALSLLISVSTELILSSNGLGAYIMRAQQMFEIAKVVAALIVIAVLGLLVSSIYSRIERSLFAWHYKRLDLGQSAVADKDRTS